VSVKPFVVGLTGGIGSGKSAVAEALARRGADVVDADVAARAVVAPGTTALAAIAERFGSNVICADGSLDRAALRRLVFADTNARHWLEALTHPLIGALLRKQLAAARSPYAVLVSPLLLEGSQRDLCDVVVVVDVPEPIQVERTMARDGNDETLVRRIMAAQLPREARCKAADIVIDNSGNLADLECVADDLHQSLLDRAVTHGA